ncbi:hypothetical protein Tco_0301213, partial [Tanacetum coccineum]
IVIENPNHLNKPNEAIPEVNQVVDIHDSNEMVDIPDDIDLVDYNDGDPEEDPEEDVDIELKDDAELSTNQTEIALLKSKNKIREKEMELLNHDLENVERALGNVLEMMSVLDSGRMQH